MVPHLSQHEQATLATFVASVRALCGDALREIRLYGSRARGEGHEESDLDVFILLTRRDKRTERALDDIAADLSVDSGLVLSPRFFSEPEWQTWLAQDRCFARAVRDEGIEL